MSILFDECWNNLTYFSFSYTDNCCALTLGKPEVKDENAACRHGNPRDDTKSDEIVG
jgi:hypothetical protein